MIPCYGPLSWHGVGDPEEAAVLECEADGCGYLVATGAFNDEAARVDAGVAGGLVVSTGTELTATAAVMARLPEAGRWVTLVPVEVFGGSDNCEACGHETPFSYGLSDAVQAWSDCNRARGHIFRVDDVDPKYRLPGETVRVWVAERDLPALVDTVWGEDG